MFTEDPILREVKVVGDGLPTPLLDEEDVYGVVYVDDGGLGGIVLDRVARIDERYIQVLGEKGFKINEKKRVKVGESDVDVRLGVVIDGVGLLLHPKPQRAVRLFRALRYFRRRRQVSVLEMQTVLGHCMSIALIRCCVTSVFRDVFKVLMAPGNGRRRLGHSGRCEIEVFRRLIPHIAADLRFDYWPFQLASDSTPTQWAVTISPAKPETLAKAWAVKGRWRHDPRYSPPATRKEIDLRRAAVIGVCRRSKAVESPNVPVIDKEDHDADDGDEWSQGDAERLFHQSVRQVETHTFRSPYARWKRSSAGLRREVGRMEVGQKPAAKTSIVKVDPEDKRPGLLQIYAGTADVTKMTSHLGSAVYAPVDAALGRELDTRNLDTRNTIINLVGEGDVGWVLLNPPSWLWDRSLDADARFKDASLEMTFLEDIVFAARTREPPCHVGIMQPRGSALWEEPRIAALAERWGPQKGRFDQCMLGCPARLSVEVLTSSTELRQSSIVCSEDHHHKSTRGLLERAGRRVQMRRVLSSYSGGLSFEIARAVNRDLRHMAAPPSNELGGCDARVEFPPLPEELVEDAEWGTLWAAIWEKEEPIHRLEGRASIGALRWAARKPDTYNRRMVLQCDNLSFVHSANKGRCTDHALLNLVRRGGAIQIAKRLRVRWRYIESDRNSADRPSRVPIQKGLENWR